MAEEEPDIVTLHEKNLLTDERKAFLQIQPASDQETEKAEQLLEADFGKLSLTEREQAAFDVHGLDHRQEDPTVVEKKLLKMEASIRKIRNKQAFERAERLSPAYVNDRTFRLKFLRCDDFNVKRAAQRYVKHFEIKRELFGDGDVLGRDILLSDLSSGAISAMESGFFYQLPIRDTSDRIIYIFMGPPQNVSVQDCVSGTM